MGKSTPLKNRANNVLCIFQCVLFFAHFSRIEIDGHVFSYKQLLSALEMTRRDDYPGRCVMADVEKEGH